MMVPMESVHIPSELIRQLMDNKPILFKLKKEAQPQLGTLYVTPTGDDTYQLRIFYPKKGHGSSMQGVEVPLAQQNVETLGWNETVRKFFCEF